jgi:hypothetical protein
MEAIYVVIGLAAVGFVILCAVLLGWGLFDQGARRYVDRMDRRQQRDRR